MKQSILKFLAFLEPEWMRVALHIFIGLSFGYNLVFRTGVTDFNAIGERIIGAFFFSALFSVALSGIYEFLQMVILGANFSAKDILHSTIASIIGGLIALLFPYAILCSILFYTAIALFSLEIFRLSVQKLMK